MITVIAEAGINWNGDMRTMRELILAAKDCGCSIFKTQVHDISKNFPDHKIMVGGKNWYEECLRSNLTKEQVLQTAEWCKEAEIEFMASSADVMRAGWLEEAGVKRHKVAYMMRHNKELIDFMLSTGKLVLLSTGNLWRDYYRPDETKMAPYELLYCVPKYPTQYYDLHLGDVNFTPGMGLFYNGFSDHTIGPSAAIVALSRGARIIEKHFTLDRSDNRGPDHQISADAAVMKTIVHFAKEVEEILG